MEGDALKGLGATALREVHRLTGRIIKPTLDDVATDGTGSAGGLQPARRQGAHDVLDPRPRLSMRARVPAGFGLTKGSQLTEQTMEVLTPEALLLGHQL